MAYSKQTWDTTSYVNPTRMNHIEEGVYDASLFSGKFGVVVGQLASTAGSWTAYMDLPSGFSNANTVMIGININVSGTWRGGDGIFGIDDRCIVEISDLKFRVFNTSSANVNAYFRATFYKFA